MPLLVMRKRADFLACNKGKRQPMPGFVLLVRDRRDGDPAIRLGITVTKKIGGAVVRNRMKRRFRALARAVLPRNGVSGADHVLIGRSGGIERDYASLARELEKALRRIQAPDKTAPASRQKPHGPYGADRPGSHRRKNRSVHQDQAGPHGALAGRRDQNGTDEGADTNTGAPAQPARKTRTAHEAGTPPDILPSSLPPPLPGAKQP